MASTQLGDIAGARFFEPAVGTFASVASNGVNAKIGGSIGPFVFPIRLRNAFFVPTGADAAATNTASFRRLSVYNGGASGTATATATSTAGGGRLASMNLTASVASLSPGIMTVDTTVTLASGQMLYFSQETVGGFDTTGTVLPAGQFSLAYEIL